MSNLVPGPVESEARFSSPHPDCPHPERWHSTDGDSTEVEVSELIGAFVRALQPDLVVESGAAWGQTSEQIGLALRKNGQGRLITSETQGDRQRATFERCRSLPVTVHCGESLNVIPSGPVGFAWLDSLEELRVDEARHYHKWMRPGSVIGIHDTGHRFPLLRAGINELVGEGWLNPLWLPTPRGVVFLQVTR